ncbi:MAG TPA: molybdopterin molybdotransferase MoeA, partial [Planctomycetota bacterium]|nr:molybdopterin molybdotransferase MoeA [Planctomycetota bacterium]
MLSKAEALAIVLAEAAKERAFEEAPLCAALGRALTRDAVADADIPPFEKSSMDGWAVRAADVARAPRTLRVLGAIHAGSPAPRPIEPGATWKIMTGAPLPEGADAVIPVEDSTAAPDGASVELRATAVPGRHVCRRGEDARAGEAVVRAGTMLDAAALAVLAATGNDPAPTFAAPRVCVIPTGDELVRADGPPPPPGKIRESNGVLLEAQIRATSPALTVLRPGVARDDRASLDRFLDVGLDHDVLVLSGGVSMGDLDLVGVALKDRGLVPLVEKVSIKPGKPLLFGHAPRRSGGRCAVFGLPGNPVSSFCTFELFVRPYLLARLGVDDVAPDEVAALLDHDREL